MTGTFIVHIPYRGSGPAITDLVGGQVDLMFDNLVSITPHARSGKVRALGVSSTARSPVFPNLPTIAEAGVKGYETSAWGGIAVPAGTSPEIVARLNTEINKALALPAVKDKFASIGADPVGGTPAQFAMLIKREIPKWADVIKRSGAKLD
jgi:tripartite-type tricarboxylate transporter receptor subunit TctC